jgi:hypothetical protein
VNVKGVEPLHLLSYVRTAGLRCQVSVRNLSANGRQDAPEAEPILPHNKQNTGIRIGTYVFCEIKGNQVKHNNRNYRRKGRHVPKGLCRG